MTDVDDSAGPAHPVWLVRIGLASWGFVGVVLVLAICVMALAAISEVAIPVILGLVLAVLFKPVADALARRGSNPTLAAGLVIAGLLAVLGAVAYATVHGVVSQSEAISTSMDQALDTAANELGMDREALNSAREAVQGLRRLLGGGSVTTLVSGIGVIVGIATGTLLGLIVMYYLVKDGARLRRDFVARTASAYSSDLDEFLDDACRTMRSYGRGRSVLSAIVTALMGVTAFLLGLPLVGTIMAVTFIGGYIPYIGAFVAGAFTALIALGNGGVGPALVIIIVSLAANLLLENFVEPKVMGRTLDIHPLTVLIVTALGGMMGGIVGLIVAVPFAIIAGSGLSRLRTLGYLKRVGDRARPAAEKALGTAGTSPVERQSKPAGPGG